MRTLLLVTALSLVLSAASAGAFTTADSFAGGSPAGPAGRWVSMFDRLAIRPHYHPATSPATSNMEPFPSSSGALSFARSSQWVDGKLKADAEVAYGGADVEIVEADRDDDHRLLRLSLIGGVSRIHYGLNYRSAGQAYGELPGQAKREAWTDWNAGMFRLRPSASRTWDDVAGGGMRSQTTIDEQKLAVIVAPSSWPEVFLSYAHGRHDRAEPPASSAQQGSTGATETIETGIAGSYGRSEGITVTPSLNYREVSQRWTGTTLHTPTLSLAMKYEPQRNLNVMAWGSFSRTEGSAPVIDTTQLRLNTEISLSTSRRGSLETTVSLGAGYQILQEGGSPNRPLEDVTGLIKLRLSGL